MPSTTVNRHGRRTARTRALAVGALVLGAVALVVALRGGGSDYRLHLRLDNASQLVKGNLVEVGGFGVGTVKSIELTNDNQADVTVAISDEKLRPLHAGTRAIVRVPSLSGVANRYVALEPGPNSAPELKSGDVIPATNTAAAVDVDAVQSTLDADTRARLQELIRGEATSYAKGGSEGFNRALNYLDPALGQMEATLGQLVADRPALERFILASSNVVQTVAARRDDLSHGLASAATTTGALARQRGALGDVLTRAPSVLGHSARTLRALATTLDAVTPTARLALPDAPRLSRVTKLARPALARGAVVLPRLRALLGPLRDVLAGLPALRSSAVPAFAAATEALQKSAPIVKGTLPYFPDVLLGATNGFGGTAAGYYDANGEYGRIAFVGGPYSAAGPGTLVPQPDLGTRYGNWERCPGAATQVARDGSNQVSDPNCNESERP